MKTMYKLLGIIVLVAIVAFSFATCGEPPGGGGEEESTQTSAPVITISTQPAQTTHVTFGSITGSLTVAASVTQSATLSYQWYSNTSNSNTGGTAVSGATNASFPIPTALAIGTYYYFVEVRATGGAASVRSNVATVTVSTLGAPLITITTQPALTTNVTAGIITGSLTVTASVTQSATLSYQWFRNESDSNTGGTAVSGATNASFPIPTDLGVGTYYYYCVVSATGGATPVPSRFVTVTVSAPGTPGLAFAPIGTTAFAVLRGTATGEIVIPAIHNGLPVTQIANDGFIGSTITSVTIPNTVTQIGSQAFDNCTALTSVTIGNSVTNIGWAAFRNTGLTSVTIPNSVTNIGSSAFENCTALTTVTIGNSVTSIDNNAFRNTGLTSVTIPNTVTQIGSQAFENCTALKSVTLPNNASFTRIRSRVFAGCSALESIYIPNSVSIIEDAAFMNCTALKSVTLSNVTSIGNNAFSRTGLTTLTIPDSVTTIEQLAFYGCPDLTTVTIGNSVTTIGNNAFANCTSLTTVTLGNSVTTIGNGAFFNTGLTSVTIPANVTTIGGGAFGSCTSLTSITVATANQNFSSVGGVLYNKTQTTLIQYPIGLSASSFAIPSTVTSIGGGAFGGNTGLTSISIPNSVTEIGGSAFRNCTALTSVTIGTGVTTIGDAAFNDSTSLTSFTIHAIAPPDLVVQSFSAFGSTHADLKIFVPVDNAGDYRIANRWNSTSGIGIRHRIHRIGCDLPNPVSLTAVCPCP